MYCSKCGSKINENATFCGNCGNQIKGSVKIKKDFGLPKTFVAMPKFDFKKILNKIKGYFTNFYVDYDSKFFKFAMIIFLAIGIGEPLYTLIFDFLPFDIYSLFSSATTVFNFLTCALLFGVFSIFVLKTKKKTTIRRSNFLVIFWIVALVLSLLDFLSDINLYQYVLYSGYAQRIVKLLLVFSTALLIVKNKPKSPIVLIISALSFRLSSISLWLIKSEILFYKFPLYDSSAGEHLINILYSLRYIILPIILFLLVYIIPRKISKWLVFIPALAVIALEIFENAEYFTFVQILSYIKEVCTVAMFVLFALSCSRKAKYDYIVENNTNTAKSVVKIVVISASSLLIIVTSYLLISAIVCSTQINNGIAKWKAKITTGILNDSAQWSSMNEDIFKYSCTKFISQFVDDYTLYETLRDNRNSMEKISKCYLAYKTGNVDEDIVEAYSNIYIRDDDWANDSVLSVYYDKYLEMQPDIENVSVSASVDVNKGQIEVTVSNNNQMPISKCTVDCKFTIVFVESGYYSNNTEYGRGTKTITVENIAGNSVKTETVSFNPDEYYNSYSSYITSFLMDKSVSIVSIE